MNEFFVVDFLQEILMDDGDGGTGVDDSLGWLVVYLNFDVDRPGRQ